MTVVFRYTLATLVPFLLILLGATLWGGFAVAALAWLTIGAAALDGVLSPPRAAGAGAAAWATRLSVLLGIGHVVLLGIVLVAMGAPWLDPAHKLALFFAMASFIGQVGHPNAHELIHRKARPLRALGALVYVSVGFGHHVSAHRRVHHRFVGTTDDPNTPLPGESFWPYLRRAWAEGFRAGLWAEEERLEYRGLGPRNWRNPYWAWVGGEALVLILAALLAGPWGLLACLGLWVLSGTQILMSDYVQHYGLQRLELPSGRLEPVGPHHSWNAPRGYSSLLMLNAPAHAEHHVNPGLGFAELDPMAEAPRLPWSMPIMAAIATVPPLWHRMMDRRAQKVMEAAEARLAAASRDAPPPETTAPSAPADTTDRAATAPTPLAARRENRFQAGRADLSPLPAIPDDDETLLARVQSKVS